MKNQSQEYYTSIQPKMPVDMERLIEVDDPVYSFNEVLRHIDLKTINEQIHNMHKNSVDLSFCQGQNSRISNYTSSLCGQIYALFRFAHL